MLEHVVDRREVEIHLAGVRGLEHPLSNETLLNSLRIVYGYDGGPKLREHLAEYLDTPEHAAFAIQLATNPAVAGSRTIDPPMARQRQ